MLNDLVNVAVEDEEKYIWRKPFFTIGKPYFFVV